MYNDSIFTKGPKWDVLRMLRWKNGVIVLVVEFITTWGEFDHICTTSAVQRQRGKPKKRARILPAAAWASFCAQSYLVPRPRLACESICPSLKTCLQGIVPLHGGFYADLFLPFTALQPTVLAWGLEASPTTAIPSRATRCISRLE